MVAADPLLPVSMMLVVAIIVVVAALAHGTLGFGFPVISTPIVALMTDIRTAIIITVFPNIVVNVVSVIRGGHWGRSMGRHWPVAVYVLIGTVIGTRVLIAIDPEPLKLLLALMIVAYVRQADMRKLDWSWLRQHQRGSALLFGLLAGFLAGSVNVTVPPLVMYFMALGLEPIAMTQMLNLCFLVGKSTQAVTLGMSGNIGLATLVASVPLTLVALAALAVGMHIQSRVKRETHQRLLIGVLWLMALVLIGQVAWHYLSSIFP